MIAEVSGALSLGSWCYLTLLRGGFWRVREEVEPGVNGVPTAAVAVIIPARNEAEVVGAAIRSLLSQDYRGPLHIFVADDESSDGTAEIARKAAEETRKSDCLTVISTRIRPAGWTGKVWAMSEAIRQAEPRQAEYYLLTDADIVHAPQNVSELVRRGEKGSYDLVSLMVQLHCESFAERGLIPAFVFFFFMLYPPSWVGRTTRSTAAAAGGCILIRRTALEKTGGMAAIRGELIDDCALAKRVKQQGGRLWLGLTSKTRSTRNYPTWQELGRMISRSAFTQLRHSAVLLGLVCVAIAVVFAAPVLLVFHGGFSSLAGIASWTLMSLAFLPVLRVYGRSPIWAPLLPLIAQFYLGATMHSAISYWRGKGGVWKDRVQDSRAVNASEPRGQDNTRRAGGEIAK